MMREERPPEGASTCPACKAPVNAGDCFCEKCGEKIPPPLPSPPAQAPVCRSCGTPLQPNARFCENCGDPVKKAESTAVPPPPAGARPISPEPISPRGLVVTEEPVTVAGSVVREDPGQAPAPVVAARESAGPVMGRGPGSEPVQKPEPAQEPVDEWEEEPAQEPDTESEETPEEEPGFAEESAEEFTEALQEEAEEELPDEPEEELPDEAEEELVDEWEEEPGHVKGDPGPAGIPAESRTGPVDELLLGLEPEEPTGPRPGTKSAGATTTTPKKPATVTTRSPWTGGFSNKTFLFIGVIGAIVLIAIAIVALLPALTGPGIPGTNAPGVQAPPVVTVTTVVTTVPAPSSPAMAEPETTAPAPVVPAATPAATGTPEQVDILPPQYTLHFEEFKDVVTGDVTVAVSGPSRNVVKDIEVTVFHPDGTTDSDHLLPSQGMTEVTVTGTRSSERVVVTVLFYSGEQYKLIDQIVSFSRRT